MLEKAIIIALIVYSIYHTMLPGEIFGKLGEWFERNLPHQIHPAVFECNICMSPWYGTALYWGIWGNNWLEWIVCAIGALGVNAIVNKLAPPRDDD